MTEREHRAREAFDVFGGAAGQWTSATALVWLRACEWAENRPSTGATEGERLWWCVRMFAPVGAVACVWCADTGREKWGRAARGLRMHQVG